MYPVSYLWRWSGEVDAHVGSLFHLLLAYHEDYRGAEEEGNSLKGFISFMLLFLCGCGYMTTAPTNLKEDRFIAEVAACARILNADVRGEITTEKLKTSCEGGDVGEGNCFACGFYQDHVAYGARWCLDRENVNPEDLADHEAAHSISQHHDSIHNSAMRRCIAARSS